MRLLLVVDMQNDFISGSLPVPGAKELIPTINKLILAFKSTGQDALVFSKDWHPVNCPHFDAWPPHCIEDTEGAEIHSEILYDEEMDYTAYKGMMDDGYSAFGDNVKLDLDPDDAPTFNANSIHPDTEFFLCGVATDWCICETAMAIAAKGFPVSIIADAIEGVYPNGVLKAIQLLKGVEINFVMSETLLT